VYEPVSKEVCDEVYKTLDKDGDGVLTYEELLYALRRKKAKHLSKLIGLPDHIKTTRGVFEKAFKINDSSDHQDFTNIEF